MSSSSPLSTPPPLATDTGLVGAALSALRHAAGPSVAAAADPPLATWGPPAAASPPETGQSALVGSPAEHLLAWSAVALVVDGVAAPGRFVAVPTDILSAGAALAASAQLRSGRQQPGLHEAPQTSLLTGVVTSNRDEVWGALVAHAVLLNRRELRAQTEV